MQIGMGKASLRETGQVATVDRDGVAEGRQADTAPCDALGVGPMNEVDALEMAADAVEAMGELAAQMEIDAADAGAEWPEDCEAPAGATRHAGPTWLPSADGQAKIALDMPVSLLEFNDYNPNVMTEEAYTQYVEEVRRLGRLPKPIVIRQADDRYSTVDGEHGLKAALDLGMPEVWVELVEADDFEARLQSHNRNLHGEADRVKQARMFLQMKDMGALSQRQLAERLRMPESTLRAHLQYAEAAGYRKSCAPDSADADIARLTFDQVREYVSKPEGDRDAWLDKVLRPEAPTPSVPAAGDKESESYGDGDRGSAARPPSSKEGGKAAVADVEEVQESGEETPADEPDVTAPTPDELLAALRSVETILERYQRQLNKLVPGLNGVKRAKLEKVLDSIQDLVIVFKKALLADGDVV